MNAPKDALKPYSNAVVDILSTYQEDLEEAIAAVASLSHADALDLLGALQAAVPRQVAITINNIAPETLPLLHANHKRIAVEIAINTRLQKAVTAKLREWAEEDATTITTLRQTYTTKMGQTFEGFSGHTARALYDSISFRNALSTLPHFTQETLVAFFDIKPEVAQDFLDILKENQS